MVKGLLFDIDGVLLDSFDSNLEFFGKLLPLHGYAAPTREEYAPLFPRTMREVIAALTKADPETVQGIWQAGRESNLRATIAPKVAAGSREAIRVLADRYKLGIATGRVKAGVAEYFEHSGLKEYFKYIVAYEDTEGHKPDPEPLLRAAKLMELQPEEMLYFGDALVDAQAAQAAGIRMVTYGENKLPGSEANVKSFQELLDLLERSGDHLPATL